MSLPSFRIKPESELPQRTLADLREWVIAECDFGNMESIQRFRVRDLAYSIRREGQSPLKQDLARRYIVRRVIGTIVSD